MGTYSHVHAHTHTWILLCGLVHTFRKANQSHMCWLQVAKLWNLLRTLKANVPRTSNTEVSGQEKLCFWVSKEGSKENFPFLCLLVLPVTPPERMISAHSGEWIFFMDPDSNYTSSRNTLRCFQTCCLKVFYLSPVNRTHKLILNFSQPASTDWMFSIEQQSGH